MTAFATSQLPTGTRAITTVEELIAWAGLVLVVSNPTSKFVREAGEAATNRFQFGSGVDSDNVIRNQVLAVLEYDTSKAGLSLPDWKKVKEASTVVIPTSFTG